MSEYPGRSLGNDEIVIQIETLTENSPASKKPEHIANIGKQVYCLRLSGRYSMNL